MLEREDTGEPVIFLTLTNTKTLFYFYQKGSSQIPVNPQRQDYWDSAFNKAVNKNKNLQWRYFIQKPLVFFNKTLPTLFSLKFHYLDEVIKYFNKNEEFSKLRRTQIDSAEEIAFFCFQELWKSINFVHHKASDETQDEILNEGFFSLSSKVPELVGEYIKTLLSKVIREDREDATKKLEIDELINNDKVDDISTRILNFFQTKKRSIKNGLDTIFDDEITNKLLKFNSANELIDVIIDHMLKKYLPLNTDIFDPFSDSSIVDKFELKNVVDQHEISLNLLNEYIKNNVGRITSQDIIEDYKPDWTRKKSYGFAGGGFIDHGIAASLILISVVGMNKEILRQIEKHDEHGRGTPPFMRHLWLAYSLTNYKDVIQINSIINFIIAEIPPTVFLHNIDFASLPEKHKKIRTYKTIRRKQPFLYICLLSDSIQKWDRHRCLNQAESDLKHLVPGSMYDIIINNNLIDIYISISSIDKESEEKNLRKNLEKYLEGICSFIQIKQINPPKS